MKEIYYTISQLLRTNTEQKLWGFLWNILAYCQKQFFVGRQTHCTDS